MPLYYKSGSSWVEFNPNPYPIGTLYYATKDTSPASLVGGNWNKRAMSTAATQITPTKHMDWFYSGGTNGYDQMNLTTNLEQTNSTVQGNITVTWELNYYSNGYHVQTINANTPLLSNMPPVSEETLLGELRNTNHYGSSGEIISGNLRLYINSNGEVYLKSRCQHNISSFRATLDINYTTSAISLGGAFVYERVA